jgi:hypothetical protein
MLIGAVFFFWSLTKEPVFYSTLEYKDSVNLTG